jgi:hypothetical protein
MLNIDVGIAIRCVTFIEVVLPNVPSGFVNCTLPPSVMMSGNWSPFMSIVLIVPTVAPTDAEAIKDKKISNNKKKKKELNTRKIWNASSNRAIHSGPHFRESP